MIFPSNWEQISWSNFVADYLKDELYPDAIAIREEVSSGIAYLFKINDTYLITRIDADLSGQREQVLVVIRGSDAAQVVRDVQKNMAINNIQKIRFHSKRKGAERFVKPLGFEPQEQVFTYG